MPRDRHKGLARRGAPAAAPAGGSWLQQSQDWPVYEVLLSQDWDRQEALAVALVARRSPRSGKIAAASFLVDLACLGVKSAFVRLCASPDDYARRLRQRLVQTQPMQPASLDLVAKIVTEGEAYARRLGLSPDPEYDQARLLLAGANPEACDTPVPLGGPEGKPFFVAGPHDNVPRIIAQLTRAVGADGFHYLVGLDPEQGELLAQQLEARDTRQR